MDFSELKDFYNYLKVRGLVDSVEQFAKRIDKSRQYMSAAMNNKEVLTQHVIDRVKLIYEKEYIEYLEYLGSPEIEKIRQKKINGRTPKGVVAVPIKVQAGYSKNIDNPVFEKDLERIYFPNSPYDGDDYRYFQMEGTSMEYVDENGKPAGLPDGTWILAERVPQEDWQSNLRKYYVHVVVTTDRLTIKRILQDNDTEIVLHADNDEYGQERLPLSEVREIWIFKRKLDWNAPPPRKIEINV